MEKLGPVILEKDKALLNPSVRAFLFAVSELCPIPVVAPIPYPSRFRTIPSWSSSCLKLTYNYRNFKFFLRP